MLDYNKNFNNFISNTKKHFLSGHKDNIAHESNVTNNSNGFENNSMHCKIEIKW